LYVGGGVDLFPTGYKFGAAPVIGLGLRFPRPTSTPEPSLGRVEVSSAVPGEILLNSRPSGSTVATGGTVTIDNVAAGRVEVAVREDDGSIVKASGPVTVRRNQTTVVRIDRPLGRINVSSAIPGEVLIDGKGTSGFVTSSGGNVTINNVEAGIVEVAIKDADGSIVKAREPVTVLQDQVISVQIERPVGSIALTSAVPGEVLINSNPTGSTVPANGTITIGNVNIGNTEVGVRETNGQISRAPNTVTVLQDQITPVRIDRSVGSVAVTSAIPGEILINGNGTGTSVATNGTVTINNVNVGNAEVGVRETSGQITRAPSVVTVRQDQTTTVRIDRASQDPRANPAGGFDIFRADGSSAAGFRVEEPIGGSGEFNVFRPDDYENWLLSPIYFEPDSATLVETYRPVLESVRRYLAANPNLRLLIRAYTAPFGTAEGRQMVSEWRADFSRDYMTQNGIAGNRIRTELYGSERIPEQVTTASSWVSYRCAELIIY
jgi:outer membrane protein OmpA-like peptidoglycan-associated protein/invasion protein IalB